MFLSNLDFTLDPKFSWYVVLLLVAGVATIVLGLLVGGRSVSWRVVDVVFGLVFFGYGVYLGFIFDGIEYFMSAWVIIIPVLLIVQAFTKWRESKKAKATAPGRPYVGGAYPGQPQAPGQPQVPGQTYAAQPGQPQAPGTGWGQPGQSTQPYPGQPAAGQPQAPEQPYQTPPPEPGSPNLQ